MASIKGGESVGVGGDGAGRAVHGGRNDGRRRRSVVQLLSQPRDLEARFPVRRVGAPGGRRVPQLRAVQPPRMGEERHFLRWLCSRTPRRWTRRREHQHLESSYSDPVTDYCYYYYYCCCCCCYFAFCVWCGLCDWRRASNGKLECG